MSPQIYEAGKGHESRPCRMEAARERLYGGCKLLQGKRGGESLGNRKSVER